MSDFWKNLWNNAGIDKGGRDGENGVDDYDVDEREARRQGYKQVKSKNGNRIWVDKQGREYVAAQMPKKKKGDNAAGNSDVALPDWTQYTGGKNPYNVPNLNSNNYVPKANNYVPPTVAFPRNEVANHAQVLNSWSQVANPYTVISPVNYSKGQTNDIFPRIQTHFIEAVTGKYLGESDEFYKLNLADELVTFPTLNINIRSISKKNWYAIPKVFDAEGEYTDGMSVPLQFTKEKVIDDFKSIVEKNKNAAPVDTRANPYAKDMNVEQALVIIHDFKNKTLTSVVLPSDQNTSTGVEVFNKLVISSQKSRKPPIADGNFLVPTNLWTDALANKNVDNNDIRKAKLIVVGFSHTHPEVNNSDVRGRKYSAEHSTKDLNIAHTTLLPDIIIKVSVDTNRFGSKPTVKLELMISTATHVGDTTLLPDFVTFLSEIESQILNSIIKNYK